MRRRSRSTWSLVVSGIAAIGIAAGTARAEGERGLFTWHPSLDLTWVVDDNVTFEDGSGDGSLGFWVAPRLELAYQAPGLDLGADLGVDLRRYLDHSSDADAELYRATVWGGLGVGHGLSLRARNAFVPQPALLGRPEDEGSNLLQTNRSDLGLHYSLPLSGSRELRAGVVGSYFLSEDYPEALPLPGGGFTVDGDFQSDFAQGLGFVEVETPLGEQLTWTLRTQASYRAYQDYSAADHVNLSLLSGLRARPAERVELELEAGGGPLSFDGFADAWRAVARARVAWRSEGGLTLWLAARHLHSPDLSGDEADETGGEVGAEQRFGSATAASLRVFATRFDAPLLDSGANLFGAVEVRLRRQLTRRLQLAVAYRHWRNAGSLEADDFRQNRIGLEFAYRH